MTRPPSASGGHAPDPARRRVVVTGAGAMSPFGSGLGPFVEGLGGGGGALVERGEAWCAPVRDPLSGGAFQASAWRRLDRASRMAALAAGQALTAAGLAAEAPDRAARGEIGVVLGTMTAGTVPLHGFLSMLFAEGPEAVSPMDFPFTVHNAPGGQCAILLGLRGPNLTTCRMEASGLAAIATAVDLVRDGSAAALVAGGVDEIAEVLQEAWGRFRILAPAGGEPFHGPFDRGRRGFAPGEGAYCLMLEELGAARRRGARIWAEVAGAATAHAPGSIQGWPAGAAAPIRSIREALADAGLAAEDLGCVVASANGSTRLDLAEAAAFRAALGAAVDRVPVTSLKGAIGECGASSAGGAVLAAISIRDGLVPPVAGLIEPDPRIGLRLQAGEGRRGSIPAALVNSMATGGTCVSLVLIPPAA
jgi:3-oxoacyl-[acyl-carrier-protein] synthase II